MRRLLLTLAVFPLLPVAAIYALLCWVADGLGPAEPEAVYDLAVEYMILNGLEL